MILFIHVVIRNITPLESIGIFTKAAKRVVN